MKKVMQTVTGFGGNCEGATLATLLRMKIEDIPSFWEGIDITKPPSDEGGVIYQKNLNKFLAKHGYKSISLGWEEPTEESVQWVEEISKQIGVKHLVAGMSPRGYMHSVIYEHGKLWHDPHPEGGGVIPCQIQFLMPIFENVKADYVVVPLSPTPKMIDSTWNDQDKIETMSHNARNEFIYKKMIYAAMIEVARAEMSNLSKAINDVLAERERQKNIKGYSTDHDDAYEQNELVRAASGYVDQVMGRAWIFESHPNLYRSEVASEFWPWDPTYWKPKSPREDLVRAAAILIAEIERLDRKEAKADAEVT